MASSNKTVAGQIENRNFLQPGGFSFQVNRAPKISYFGKTVTIPALNMGVTEQPNYLRPIPMPGEIIDFEDLTFSFLVDEDLENYIEIQNWIRGIGFPESLNEIYKWQNEDKTSNPSSTKNLSKDSYKYELNLYSDATMMILDSMQRPNFKVVYENVFPTRLSTLEFDATQTDLQYFTAQVSFKYTIYNIEKVDSCC